MERIGAALLILGSLEIGQHVLEAPAEIAELTPVIEILLLPADIDEAVDRARPAQHPAARLDDAAIVELGLGFGLVEPVELAITEQLAIAERDMNPGIAILAARLQQQHAVPPRRAQPVGEHAPGRAATDDDIIETAEIAHRMGCHPTKIPPSRRQSYGPAIALRLECRQVDFNRRGYHAGHYRHRQSEAGYGEGIRGGGEGAGRQSQCERAGLQALYALPRRGARCLCLHGALCRSGGDRGASRDPALQGGRPQDRQICRWRGRGAAADRDLTGYPPRPSGSPANSAEAKLPPWKRSPTESGGSAASAAKASCR